MEKAEIAGQLENHIRVICRPALESDTPDVLELTRTIWEGEDYVPEVWQEWLEDEQGALLVAEYQKRVIGLGKLSRQSETDWWMHGLRVDPEFEGHGVASQLHQALVETWEKIGSGVVRLVTASFREPVQHLSQKSGFHKVDEFTPFVADAVPDPQGDVAMSCRPVQAEQFGEAFEFAMQAETLKFNGRQIDLGWEWQPLNLEMLKQIVHEGRAWWWRGREGIVAVSKEDRNQKDSVMRLHFIATRMERLCDLLADTRRLAGRLNYDQAGWMASLRPEIISALEAAGFRRDWDASIFLYEKQAQRDV